MKNFYFLLFAVILSACNGEDNNLEYVFIDSGAVQCEYGGDTTQQTAQSLIKNGIEVLKSACGYKTELSVITLCGAGTLEINLHKVHTEDLPAAEELGFSSVSILKTEISEGYEFTSCENRGKKFSEK